MAKAFEWALLIAVLAGAGTAVVQLPTTGDDALLGILGLLLFAAAASALRLGRFSRGHTGGALPVGVDWRSGLPRFNPHDATTAGRRRDSGDDAPAARGDVTREP